MNLQRKTAVSSTVRRIVRFIICACRHLPYYGYEGGCDYCAMCPRAISLGHCDRGERMGYKQCGTVDLESNAPADLPAVAGKVRKR